MPTLQTLLVPIDYSEGSKTALGYAQFLAHKFEGHVTVVHVYEVPPHVGAKTIVKTATGDQTLSDMLMAQAKEQAAAFLAHFEGKDGAVPPCRFIEGQPGKAIVKEAEQGSFDMVVIGTQGKNALARILMGSVAEYVVRNCTCPVLTVRAS